MNKKTTRIAGWALGLSMAVAGIGAAVGASQKTPVETKASSPVTVSYSATAGNVFGGTISTVNGTSTNTQTLTDAGENVEFDLVGVCKLKSVKSGKSDYRGFSSPYAQIGSGNANVELTLTAADIPGIIKSVDVYAYGSNHTMTVEVDGASYYSETLSSGAPEDPIHVAPDAGGELVVTFSATSAKALYFSSISVTYEEPSFYSVTYDANDADDGSVPVDGNEYALEGTDKCTVLGNVGGEDNDGTDPLTKEHYTWNGWNTKPDGKGTTYKAGDKFDVGANTRLYALWVSNGVWLSTESGNVKVGSTLNISSYVNGATGSVTYESGDVTKATVDSSGVITGVADGSVAITVSDAGTSTSATFTVNVSSYTPVTGINSGADYIIVASSSHYFTGTFSGGAGQTSLNSYQGMPFVFTLVADSTYQITSGSNYLKIIDDTKGLSLTEEATSLSVSYTDGEYRIIGAASRYLAWYSSNSDIRSYKTGDSKITLLPFDENEFSAEFLTYYTGGCNAAGGYTSANMHWTDAATRFSKLSSAERLAFKNASANDSGTNLQKAAARYDYIVGKYGSGVFSDFAERNPSPIAFAPIATYNTGSTNNIPLIAVLAGIGSITLIGGSFLLIRKRKED